MIHITYDMSMTMNNSEGPRDIGCNVHYEPIICFWKSL